MLLETTILVPHVVVCVYIHVHVHVHVHVYVYVCSVAPLPAFYYCCVIFFPGFFLFIRTGNSLPGSRGTFLCWMPGDVDMSRHFVNSPTVSFFPSGVAWLWNSSSCHPLLLFTIPILQCSRHTFTVFAHP
ncbi:hypothetical protein GGS26DRAFT_271169 [Hypomontagnella submonticulosa]|nr:hypothetical protein GGS26DRAFT_271169 [Hypomontagnella submonticulosa]